MDALPFTVGDDASRKINTGNNALIHMKLHVVGGGSCLIRNFTEYDPTRVTINGDICATAKGYELLASRTLGRKGA